MRNFNRLAVFFSLALLFGVPSNSSADVYEDGVAAYQAGRYPEALGIWKWLAETGNVDAQFHLGLMYESGQGVVVDESIALSWFLRAADEGHEQARNGVARMLARKTTPRTSPIAAKRLLLAAVSGPANATTRDGLRRG